nr:uncharacterized protein LOC115266799 [Aedes albopictus]
MSVHSAITAEWINSHDKLIREAPLVIMDANISVEAMRATFELCLQHDKPVFFEPTDMRFAAKPFAASDSAFKVIRFVTPNLYELREMARHLGYQEPLANTLVENFSELDDLLREVRSLGTFVVNHVDNVIVTLGNYGVAVVRRSCEHTPFFDSRGAYQRRTGDTPQVRFYPGRKLDYIVNVSGAGDSFSSGFISADARGPDGTGVRRGGLRSRLLRSRIEGGRGRSVL